MYQFIYNPVNNRKVFVNSTLGNKIIKRYAKNLTGGYNEIVSDSDEICDEDRCESQFWIY